MDNLETRKIQNGQSRDTSNNEHKTQNKKKTKDITQKTKVMSNKTNKTGGESRKGKENIPVINHIDYSRNASYTLNYISKLLLINKNLA